MALIIGGHPRSGTTILNKLCQRHPDIVMTGEFRNFLELGVSYPRYIHSIRKDWYRRGILDHSGYRAPLRAKLRSASFLAEYSTRLALCGKPTIGYTEIKSVLRAMFSEAKLVGDKYPSYIFAIDKLALVDGLKRVIIYRDGRDVVSSFLKMARNQWRDLPAIRSRPPTADSIAKAWVRSIELMEQHTDRLHIIRYEALVQDPQTHLAALADYLGVASEGFQSRPIHQNSVSNYKTGLTPQELSDVLKVAATTLSKLGYAV